MGKEEDRGVGGEGLSPAFRRAAQRLGSFRSGRGHPARFLARSKSGERGPDAGMEPRRRVRGGAQEGAGGGRGGAAMKRLPVSLFAVVVLLFAAARADAQGTSGLHFGFEGGISYPQGSTKDSFDNG